MLIAFVGSAPLILDLIRAFFPKFPIRIPARQAGIWLLTMLSVLAAMIVFVWFEYFLPFYVATTRAGPIRICFHFLCCSFLMFRSFYHMFASFRVSSATLLGQLPEDQIYLCRVCNAQIFQHDHHCPFVANCVGYKNQRHFLSFIGFLWLGDIYSIFMSWPPFYQCWWNYAENGETDLCIFISSQKMMFVLALWSLVPVSWLFFWQLFVCYTNTSTRQIIQTLRKLDSGITWQMKVREWLAKGSMANFQRVVGAGGWPDFIVFPWMSPAPTLEFAKENKL